MKSLSGVGLGLSVVFGCLLLAFVAELYYLLCWKKRNIITKTTIDAHDQENLGQIPPKKAFFCYIFCCWKKPTSSSSFRSTAQELCSSATSVHEPQSSSNSSKDHHSWLNKPFDEQNTDNNFHGLPGFLFTITEETREDLESEDGSKNNNNNNVLRGNLSDLLQILETPPFLTPTGSPPYFTPPLTPSHSQIDVIHQQSLGPFLDSSSSSSPPPKFKFLRDAEEKLIQRRKIINEDCGLKNKDLEKNGPFITIVVGAESQENGENEGFCCQHNSHRNKNNNNNNILQEKECFSSGSSS